MSRRHAWVGLVVVVVGCGGATLDVGANETAPASERPNVAVMVSFRSIASGGGATSTQWSGATMGGESDADWNRRDVGPCAIMKPPASALGKGTPWFDLVTVKTPSLAAPLLIDAGDVLDHPATSEALRAPATGEAVLVSAQSGSVPGFGERALFVPGALVLHEPVRNAQRIGMSRREPLELLWAKAQGTLVATVRVERESGGPLYAQCRAPGTDGRMLLPAELWKDMLPGASAKQSDVGARVRLALASEADFDSGGYRVHLSVVDATRSGDELLLDARD